MSVHISRFYPCSKIENGIEMLYVIELSKYLALDYNETLDLNGVRLGDKLRYSRYWGYFGLACRKFWIRNAAEEPEAKATIRGINTHLVEGYSGRMDREEHQRRHEDIEYDFNHPYDAGYVFESKTDVEWVWSGNAEGDGAMINRVGVLGENTSVALISLIACVAVRRLKEGAPETLKLKFFASHCRKFMATAYFIWLYQEKPECFSGWVNAEFDETLTKDERWNLLYYGWYMAGRERGLLNRAFSIEEKIKHVKEDMHIEVGDVVCVYGRGDKRKDDPINGIEDCHIGVVRELTDKYIVFDYINTVHNFYHGRKLFSQNTTKMKAMWSEGNRPYEHLNVTQNQRFDWYSIGVGYYMFFEEHFFIPFDDEDWQVRYVDDGAPIYIQAWELMYWILCEYGYRWFDKERFKARYIKGMPLYDRFLSGDDLEELRYEKEADVC